MRLTKVVLCLVASAALSSAALLTTVSGGTTTDLTGTEVCSGAGSATAGGFSLEADGEFCAAYSSTWGFIENGTWDGLPLVGDNSSNTTITIDLGGLFSSVGGFMNYGPSGGVPSGLAPFIAVLDINGDVLETYNIYTDAPINTPSASNEGAFRGISRDSADIAFFRFGGSYSAFTNLTLDGEGGSTVPEPSTGMILGGALAALGLVGRRIRK